MTAKQKRTLVSVVSITSIVGALLVFYFLPHPENVQTPTAIARIIDLEAADQKAVQDRNIRAIGREEATSVAQGASVPVLALREDSNIAQSAGIKDSSYTVIADDGYLAIYVGEEYTLHLNGTKWFYPVDPKERPAPPKSGTVLYHFNSTEYGAEIRFSAFGADYSVSVFCNSQHSTGCLQESKARDLLNDLVVVGKK
jgi:hypothetical protein